MNEDIKLCEAKTKSGKSCQNIAVFPEDDPKYCHLPQHQEMFGSESIVEEEENNEKDEDSTIKEDVNFDVAKHIFSSRRTRHTVVFPYKGEKEEAKFKGGMWQTSNDDKALAFLKHINSINNLRRVINKVQ